ncbi:putative nucleotide/nucleic acid binding protein [Blattamonas nauphoetae]|uniref:Nucleotide/nucleic acid binding protein n=1 Tax=Blattamonas nauphoetae TaxID=2049346 RepID=A0ABQ9Y9V0_9EUKA|nr:putative nucleotide/nucleic acid binding protein [Blattamonas nauphoetae]
MTRLIVEGLPTHLKDAAFRAHFSDFGTLTDAKIMRTSTQKSRRFGFIGFKEEGLAESAIKHFNNTYIDTGKIRVAEAKPVGDSSIPLPKSQKSQKRRAYSDSNKNIQKETFKRRLDALHSTQLELKNDILRLRGKSAKQDDNDDEVAQAYKTKPSEKTWSNLDVPSTENVEGELKEIAFDGDSDDEDDNDEIMQLDIEKGLVQSSKGKNSDEKRRRQTEAEDGEDLNKFQTEQNSGDFEEKFEEGMIKDEEQEQNYPDNDSQFSNFGQQGYTVSKHKSAHQEVAADTDFSLLLETHRLRIINLPYSATESDIQKYFSAYTQSDPSQDSEPKDETDEKSDQEKPTKKRKRTRLALKEVKIVRKLGTGESRGVGYVEYTNGIDAVKAYQHFNDSIFLGRVVRLEPAHAAPSTEAPLTSSLAASESFKQKRLKQLKASTMSEAAMNTLFIPTDTAVAAASSLHGMTSAGVYGLDEMKGGDGSNAAVRAALAEAEVVNDTRTYLEKEGVVMDHLSLSVDKEATKVKRSDRILLIKGLSFDSDASELERMFQTASNGTLTRFIMPPTKAICVVEFSSPTGANTARQKLHYKRYLDRPLLLEWAPEGVLVKKEGTSVEEVVQASDEIKEGRTLHLKGLGFDVTEERLKQELKQFGGKVVSASIPTRRKKKGGQELVLSMGFAFVEYARVDDAVNAFTKMKDGFKIDERPIKVDFSRVAQPTATDTPAPSQPTPIATFGEDYIPFEVQEKSAKTKVVVKNVAFQTTSQDLRELFSVSGHVKSIRLPKKHDGSIRGFAFIEFATEEEAKKVVESFKSIHLYGKRLVLEWADDDKSVDEIREKTTELFAAGQEKQSAGAKSVREELKRLEEKRISENGEGEGNEDGISLVKKKRAGKNEHHGKKEKKTK